jgi:hypothetical protein
MSIVEARALQVGDRVVAYNGRYEQHAVVTDIKPHHREGFWITFQWQRGKALYQATKRHVSVHLDIPY